MALVDPNIALSYKPLQVADPVAQYGRMAAIQNAQAQNQLAQARLMEQNRLSQEREAMNALYSSVVNPQTGAIDYNALISGAAQRGLGSQIPGITKQFRESEEATNKALRSRSELIDAKLKQSRQFLENINPADPNAPQLYMRWHEANHADPVLGPMLAQRGITADQSRARIEQAIAAGPAAFTQMLQQSILGIDKFTELNRPVTEKFNLGGAQVGVSRPGLQPANYYMQNVPEPEAVQAQKLARAEASAARTQVEVQNFTPASVEAQKAFMKSTRETYDALKAAPAAIQNIEKAKQLIPTAATFMGPGGEPLLNAASFLNSRLGTTINTQGVKDATELRSRLFQGILDNLKKLDAQPTERQQAALREALGSLGTDPNALSAVLDSFADTVRTKVELYNDEVKSAIDRNVVFPYAPIIKLPAVTAPKTSAVEQIPTGRSPAAAPAAAPIYARNPATNERIMSTDGGNTWQPAR